MSFDTRKKLNKFRPLNYMGACFQAPHATPRQETDGNAPCSLIIIFLYFSMLSSTNHLGMYQTDNHIIKE